MPAPGPEPTVIVVGPRPAPAPPDVQEAVAQAVQVAFGLLSVGISVVLRAAGEAPATPGTRRDATPLMDAADLLVGTAWGAARLSGRIAVTGSRVARPLVSLAARPPLVPPRLQPAHGVQVLVQRWQRDRPDTVVALGSWTSTVLPGAVDAAMSQVDVERLVTLVLDRVDLDRVIAVVLQRIDLDRVIAAVLQQIDLAAVVTEALEQIDLTQVVLDQVELGRVIDEALDKVDLTEIVLQKVDLIGVAEYVVEGIDLPEIIRDSTLSVSSEAVRGLRMQGVDADQAVARIADRILHRRRRQAADTLIPPQAEVPQEPLSREPQP